MTVDGTAQHVLQLLDVAGPRWPPAAAAPTLRRQPQVFHGVRGAVLRVGRRRLRGPLGRTPALVGRQPQVLSGVREVLFDAGSWRRLKGRMISYTFTSTANIVAQFEHFHVILVRA